MMMVSSEALHIGPLMLPWPLLSVCAALVILALFAYLLRAKLNWSSAMTRRFHDTLWSAFFWGLLGARIGFVLLHWDAYSVSPLEIFKIQDQGFYLYSGLLLGGVYFWCRNKDISIGHKSLLMGVFMLLLCAASTGQKALQHETHYPHLSFQPLQHEAQPLLLPQLIGQPTVINLWASWCPPCHREMPVLQQAQQQHPAIQFVMLNQAEDATTVAQYLKQHHFNFNRVLLDPEGKMAVQMKMFGLPSSLFFNAQGQLVSRHMGELSPAMLQQYLDKITQ